MIIPGSNLLSMALRVINSTPVTYYQFLGTTQDARGTDINDYAPGVLIPKGSVQPIPKSRYEQFGLDFAKSYVMWYVPSLDASAISRNPYDSGDVIETNGRRYQITGTTEWFKIDGWQPLIGVDIGPANA